MDTSSQTNYKAILIGAMSIGIASIFYFLPTDNSVTPEINGPIENQVSAELETMPDPAGNLTFNSDSITSEDSTEQQLEVEDNRIIPAVPEDSEFRAIEIIAEEPSVETVSNNSRTSDVVLLSSKKLETFNVAQVDTFARRFYGGYPYERAINSVEKWEITFNTKHENNEDITGNALVYMPIGDGPFPILGSAAGTTGIDDACAPSRENVNVSNWGDYEGYHAAFAGQGYAVVFPDYSGFNDTDGLHHYFVADLQAKVVLDSLKAIRNLAAQINIPLQEKIYLSGYSQGAHSILAAADIYKTYAPNLPIAGLITYGAANHTVDLLKFNSNLGPYLIYAYQDLYGKEVADADKLLLPRFARSLITDHKQCVGKVGNFYGYDGSKVYSPELWNSLSNGTVATDFPQFYEALARNISGYGDWNFPTLILQGATDRITPPEQNRRLLERLCVDQKPTTYRELASTSHVYTRQRSFKDTLTWIDAVNSGENFPNSCATL